MNKRYVLITILVTFFAIINSVIYFFVLNIPSTSIDAQKGVSSLKQWDLEQVSIIDLRGEWLYYPDKLLTDRLEASEGHIRTVPDIWGNGIDFNSAKGYGVYNLHLTDLQPNKVYGFFIQDEVTAYKLNVNGENVASNGIVSNNEAQYEPEWRPVIGMFNANHFGEAELNMEVGNYYYNYGGFWNSIKIGDPQAIIGYMVNRTQVELILFSIIFLIGIVFLFLYFSKRQDKSLLYFSLFSLCISFRILLTGIRLIKRIIPSLDWNIAIRLEYLFGYLLMPLFCLFILYFFYHNQYHRLKAVIKGIAIILGASALILPHQLYISLLTPYKYASMAIVILAMLIVIIEFKKNIFYESLMMIALINYTAAIIKEIAGGEISLLPIATLNFIICFSIIMLNRFLRFLKKNEMLAIQASFDSITGLYNRHFLKELAKNYFDKNEVNKTAYVLFLDLDNFKDINDTHGHETGDLILQIIGQRLRNNLRNIDMICRYGGDEFVIIIKGDTNIDEIAGRLIKTISEPIHTEKETLSVGVSIGISQYSTQQISLDELIKQSDKAMYIAKRDGGNQYAFYSNDINICDLECKS